MKIKRYNESNKPEITKEILMDQLTNSLDLSKEYEIDYYDDESCHGSFRTWIVKIGHNFYDECELSDFREYVELIKEIDHDINRLTGMYDCKISFEERSNDSITIIIS